MLMISVCRALARISLNLERILIDVLDATMHIGTIYNKIADGKFAPLRVLNIYEKWPDDLKEIRVERFTPTFELVEDGKK